MDRVRRLLSPHLGQSLHVAALQSVQVCHHFLSFDDYPVCDLVVILCLLNFWIYFFSQFWKMVAVGTTKQCCLSSTTGRRPWRKGSPTNLRYVWLVVSQMLKKKAEILKLSTDSYETQLVILWGLKNLEPYNLRGFFFWLLQWNEYMDRDHRESYYFNWPVYFP